MAPRSASTSRPQLPAFCQARSTNSAMPMSVVSSLQTRLNAVALLQLLILLVLLVGPLAPKQPGIQSFEHESQASMEAKR